MELSWSLVAELFAIAGVIYWYASKKYNYWSTRNVQGPKPLFLLGNLLQRLRFDIDDFELRWTKNYGKVYGTYIGFEPVLTVTDPELVKQMMVKDFDKFINRRLPLTEHKLWDKNLFALEDEKWKVIRSITSPTFTSGKLRGMHQLMNQTVDRLINYLDRLSSENDKVMDAKEIIGGFTMDTIALTSFATQTDTNGDRSSKNPFLEQAKNFFNISTPKIMMIVSFPMWLLNLLNIRLLFDAKSYAYFTELTRQILKQRRGEKKNTSVKRNDLVQLLLDASVDEKELANTSYEMLSASADNDAQADTKLDNSSNSMSVRRKLDDDEIIAQCILFMSAGYETTAATITNLLYELAVNQDIQDRLCDEVSQALEGFSDKSSHQYFEKVINEIPLLEATVKETLRKYPPVYRVDRRVGVDGYKLGGIELYKDQIVEVSVYSIHHSEENYPNPSQFDPDRFMPENKHLLVPYTYLPFGTGPRNCIGMRFAYQEIKLVMVELLTRYRFEPTADTPIPLKFNKGLAFLSIDKLPIKVSKR